MTARLKFIRRVHENCSDLVSPRVQAKNSNDGVNEKKAKLLRRKRGGEATWTIRSERGERSSAHLEQSVQCRFSFFEKFLFQIVVSDKVFAKRYISAKGAICFAESWHRRFERTICSAELTFYATRTGPLLPLISCECETTIFKSAALFCMECVLPFAVTVHSYTLVSGL